MDWTERGTERIWMEEGKKSRGKQRGNGWEGKREEKRENDLGSMKDARGVKE